MSSVSGPAGPSTPEIQTAPPAPPPSAAAGRPHRGLWAGIVLVVVGAYLLLANLGIVWWWDWRYGGPVLLILPGLLILVRRLR